MAVVNHTHNILGILKTNHRFRPVVLYQRSLILTCFMGLGSRPGEGLARRIRKRSSHKKACVALARKLAVIMHRMLITGEAFRWPEKGPAA